MKRSELKVGEQYAVLAPSQDPDGDYAPRAKRVRVLDTEPVWVERYRESWGEDKRPVVEAQDFDGNLAPTRDGTRAADLAHTYSKREAAKVVKVYVGGYEGLTVVPLSQVRMTWAEYVERRRKADAARKARDAVVEKARAEVKAEERALRAMEEEAGLEDGERASFDHYGRRPEVALTRGQYHALLKRLTEGRNA